MEKRIDAEINLHYPDAFLRRMAMQLGEDYPAFVRSFSEPARYGLRANPLKITPEALAALLPGSLRNSMSDSMHFQLLPVAWCREGFSFPPTVRPAKSWPYHAGLFYIQEPSAMCPAAVLNAQPGDRVLDICAAPGGKSAQLAGQMQGRGVLVANDASASRCNALIRNLEMAGVTNAVVLNEQPKRLAERFPCYFDRILVDAPCSGEGMFRRDPDAVKGWAENKPEACVRMQREILHFAAAMLKPGGWLVYSTCTFSPDENEGVIAAFLADHADFMMCAIDHVRLGLDRARPEWIGAGTDTGFKADTEAGHGADEAVGSIGMAARIWPQRAAGEGHFIALLGRRGDGEDRSTVLGCLPASSSSDKPGRRRNGKQRQRLLSPLPLFTHFAAHYLNRTFDGTLVWHGRSLFAIPTDLPDINGLRVARSGWYLGDAGKDRFTPSQGLAMGLTKAEARYTAELSPDEIERYLKGETISFDKANFDKANSDKANFYNVAAGYAAGEETADAYATGKDVLNEYVTNEKPWVLVCAQGYPLGWGRWVNGRLKNARPPGWAVR